MSRSPASSNSAFGGALNVERVNALIHAAEMETRGIFMAADTSSARASAARLRGLNDRIGDLVVEWQWSLKPQEVDEFEAFAVRIKQFQEFCRELVERGSGIGESSRASGDETKSREMRLALNRDLESFARLYSQRSRHVYATIEQGIAHTAWLLSLIAASAVLLAAAGAVLIRGGVVKPLGRITRITEAVAAGESRHSIPYRERLDEIGALARSIGVFQDAMHNNHELSRKVLDDAENRALRQERVTGEIGRFGADVEATLAELGRIADHMLAASTRLAGAADIATVTTATAAGASAHASENVRDIASAADELAASVTEIDRQVAQSNAIASKAVSEAACTNATV